MSVETHDANNIQTWAISLRVGSRSQANDLKSRKGWVNVDGFALLYEKTCLDAEARSDYDQCSEGALLLRAAINDPLEKNLVGIRWVIAVQRGNKLYVDAMLRPMLWHIVREGHTLLYTKRDFMPRTTALDDLNVLSRYVTKPRLYCLDKQSNAINSKYNYRAMFAGIGGLYVNKDVMMK